jgi:uncharacterized protein
MSDGSDVLAALYRGDRVDAEARAHGRQLDAYEAAALGRSSDLRPILREKPELARTTSTDGFTALHLAAFFSGDAETARALLEAGADPNGMAANDTGLHPIHSAAAAGNNDLVALLVECGAQIDAPQRGGYTALHSAAANGNDDLVLILIQAGADTSRRAEDGRTALSLAQERGHPQTARLIIDHHQASKAEQSY